MNPQFKPKKLPKGNEVAISSGLAQLDGKKVGDSISFFLETKKYDFTITEIIRSSSSMILFDAEYVDKTNKYLCIKTNAEKNSEEYQEIVNFLETRGVLLVSAESVFYPISSRLVSYMNLLTFILIIGVFTTLLGIINVLVSADISRRRERAVYFTVGMSKKDVRKTKVLEIGYILLLSAILIPLFAFSAVLIIDIGISSFGLDVLYF